MLLCYLDESFTRDHYYIAAMICPEDQALSLEAALDAVVLRAAESFAGVSTSAELHGYDILQGRRDWLPLAKMPRARINVYDQALVAISQHQVQVVIEGIHPTSRLRSRDPHSMLMSWILERIDEYASRRGLLALVIADEPGQRDQQGEYRADLGSYRATGTGGWKARKITRIVDTLHFAPSRSSRLVQAADLLAFLYHRRATKRADVADPREIRVNDLLWGHLDGVVHNVHVWQP
ncbi:DUF3800 domain-containing protein [Saccharopolyspora sp. K220]|uniref:DUF3800 domain-containing protein n=1 Tax=Saccharopolyspora soli TaxID=2926618 RepID=UPI001F59F57E|nr:DUF3800 domain-containing protein [Saccharopolyspora soli]MCI2421072.1 DUF3800 domain-containing protein [Saccharopolyspora soli]